MQNNKPVIGMIMRLLCGSFVFRQGAFKFLLTHKINFLIRTPYVFAIIFGFFLKRFQRVQLNIENVNFEHEEKDNHIPDVIYMCFINDNKISVCGEPEFSFSSLDHR